MSKTAIIIMSDPKAGLDESTGRLLNGLAAAYDYKAAGDDVKIIFQGTGSRWPELLQKEDHMAHKIFKAIEENIEGISAACASVWGAEPSGYDLIKNNPIPGTPGLSSFVKLEKEGYNILTF